MKIKRWKTKIEYQGLHTTGLTHVVFQVRTKVIILFDLFHFVSVSTMKMAPY